ncbi:MAG: TonB-dependent receptor plug domain-containing protein [Odoribacteraceae bacterium]|nr:TonB-dependent receptor plug domain-containing protein [Odoribacteraceae bacterium]
MKRFLFFIFCAAVASRAGATGVDTTRARVLDGVTVLGTRAAREVVPVQVLAGEELRRLSAFSVADAIRYFAGVQVKDYGGIGGLKTVNVRAMGSHHVGVFYDGVELGNAQNGVVDLGRFSLDNVEAVSLYNGQKSATLQTARDFASASAVYLTMRVPTFDEGKGFNARASVKGGSFGTVNPAVTWERRLGEGLSSSLGAGYVYTTGRYKFSYRQKNGYDTTETRRNGEVRALRVEPGLFGKFRGGDWKARVYLYHSERGYPGAAVREEPGKFSHQDWQRDLDLFAQASARASVGPRYDVQFNAKWGYNELHYRSDPRLDVTTMYIDNRYRQREVYLSSAHRVTLVEGWSASLSADFQWNALDADLFDFVYPRRYTALAAAATAVQLPRFSAQASVLGTFTRETARGDGAAAPDRRKFTPTVAASWQPWGERGANFRVFYKRVFRVPTFNDLYYTFIGNKNLNPEYTTQVDAGVTFARALAGGGHVAVRVDVYYNEVTDKIVAMPTSNQFRWTMMNLGFVEVRGAEVAVKRSWRGGERWWLDALVNYTFQRARDLTNPGSEFHGGQIPYIPRHAASLVLGGGYGTWEFKYSFIYTGERYSASANIPENHVKPWYTSDLAVSRSVRRRGGEARVTVEVNNLFNQQYEVVRWYPMPGTNVYVKLGITI